jgi:non-ribosomal peptide synthetase component F
MSIIVENCGHFPQGKSQSYITNNLLLLNKDHEKQYTSGISDEPLGLTIGEAFEETVSRFPKNEAVVSKHQNIRYTYEQLEIRVNQCAKHFWRLTSKG